LGFPFYIFGYNLVIEHYFFLKSKRKEERERERDKGREKESLKHKKDAFKKINIRSRIV
jgi:hypothetical protein